MCLQAQRRQINTTQPYDQLHVEHVQCAFINPFNWMRAKWQRKWFKFKFFRYDSASQHQHDFSLFLFGYFLSTRVCHILLIVFMHPRALHSACWFIGDRDCWFSLSMKTYNTISWHPSPITVSAVQQQAGRHLVFLLLLSQLLYRLAMFKQSLAERTFSLVLWLVGCSTSAAVLY